MRARYYLPDLMRFINQDIITGDISNSGSLNRYAYVEGNPVTLIDPFGLCAERTSKQNLLIELSAVTNADLNWMQKMKDFYYSNSDALDKVLNNDELIMYAANKYGVDKAMIQAVLFREIRCYGLDDPVADSYVMQSYSYEKRMEQYNEMNWIEQLVNPQPEFPSLYRLDSSTGIYSIFLGEL